MLARTGERRADRTAGGTRWTEPSEGDDVLLDACSGPTVDLGCGPGRLTAALAGRGVVALGVDSSRTAVGLTRRRGGSALQRDIFDRLPGEGRWRHALLADGNIGIGGDPAGLLRRTARLIAADGDILVELEPPGQGLRHERVRLRPGHADVAWFTWAWVGRRRDRRSRRARRVARRLDHPARAPLVRAIGAIVKPPIPAEEQFRAPAHHERVTSKIGLALAVTFTTCFVTGLISHLIQHPPEWFWWPSRPVGLYRVTQGLHVISGVASIPLLLAKLWSVYPSCSAGRRPRRCRTPWSGCRSWCCPGARSSSWRPAC